MGLESTERNHIVKIFTRAFWEATAERMFRGAVAAEVGAYLAGNVVFDTTNIKGTLENVLAIGAGGAFSALAISLGVQKLKKNGPALVGAEILNPPTPEPEPAPRIQR